MVPASVIRPRHIKRDLFFERDMGKFCRDPADGVSRHAASLGHRIGRILGREISLGNQLKRGGNLAAIGQSEMPHKGARGVIVIG